MKTARAAAIDLSQHAASTSIASARVVFMDNIRYLMVVLVLVYQSVAAYAIVAPHWAIHDTNTFAADIIRELFDVFMMPVLFFAAGYFALPTLEKKGVWEFLKDKVQRLLVPWALAVLIILPLALYDQPVKPIRPFWKYWLNYLSSFEVRLRFTQAPVGITTQAIYWFISLLFAFFLLFALIYALARRWRGGATLPAGRKMMTGNSVLVALVVFGLLTSVAYFVLLLVVPDSSWFTLYMFLEFQVTRLVPFAAYFAFGVYAQSRGWFADGKPLGSLTLWGAISAVLAVAYLVFGQPMFADTAGTANLSVGYLAGFRIPPLVPAVVAVGRVRFVRGPLLESRERARPATRGGVLQHLPRPFLYRGGAASGAAQVDGRSRAGQDRNRFPCGARVEFCNQPMGAGAPLARVWGGDPGTIRVLPCCPPVNGKKV